MQYSLRNRSPISYRKSEPRTAKTADEHLLSDNSNNIHCLVKQTEPRAQYQ